MTVGEKSLANREDVALVLFDQLAAGSRVTGEAAANERGVGGHDGPFYPGIPGGMQVGFRRRVSEW
jgi:hypothetical protein